MNLEVKFSKILKKKLLKENIVHQQCLFNFANFSVIQLIKAAYLKFKAIGNLFVERSQFESKRKF
jgi:hypothetical protein